MFHTGQSLGLLHTRCLPSRCFTPLSQACLLLAPHASPSSNFVSSSPTSASTSASPAASIVVAVADHLVTVKPTVVPVHGVGEAHCSVDV